MKILFLPINIASMPAITAASLNKMKDVEAVFLTKSDHKYQSKNDKWVYIPQNVSRKKPLHWAYNKLTRKRRVSKWIEWADVLHYSWGPMFPDAHDLALARKLNKRIIIEWVGSDIRKPEFLKSINKYYKQALDNGYEYAGVETEDNSRAIQKLFSSYGAVPVLCPEMTLFLEKSLFSEHHVVLQRINVNDFKPVFESGQRPLIIHSPSAKVAKGSYHIMEVIEKLKKRFEFDFELLENRSRQDVLDIMQKADIFVDQIIIGSYGMAAMEAMSFGKPVICYIMPEVYQSGLPSQCPVVNSNPDNLEATLSRLLENPSLRREIGLKSRQYVEEFHDADKLSHQLLSIYAK